MLCPSTGETLSQITEKTKLLAQKCSNSESTLRQPTRATFKSYIDDVERDVEEANVNPIETKNASQSHRHHHTFQCLTVNLSNLNRLIKTRCSFVSSTSPTCSDFNYTFPRKKKSTAKWYIKVSL